ncbi:proteoglycan 4, partial [Parasteatoda tepidariorum]|uniref:proteoglycan 4 n=1 Tax=Parasteatoda tepidariorum TaxID=114398 RepID=UPI0039BC6576
MSQEETEDATTASDEELSERSISTLDTSEAKAEHCMSDSVVTIDYDEATLRSQDVADEHSNTPVIGTNEYQSIALDLSKGKSAACGVSSKDSLLSFSQNIKFYSPTKQMDISNLNIEESKQSDATKCAKHNLPFKKRILSGEEYVSKPDSKKLNTSTESNLEPLSSNKKEVTEDTIQQPELAESDNGAIGIKGSSASVKDVDEIAALKAAVLARRALKVLSPEKEISVQSSSSHQIQTTSLDRIQMTSQHQIQIMNPDRIQRTSQHQIQMMDPPQEQRTSSDRIQGTSPDQIQRMGSDRIQRTNPSLLQMRNPILTQMISQNDQMEPQTPMTSQPQTPMTNLPLSQMTNLPLSQTTSTYPMFQMSPPQRPVGSTLQMLLAWPPQMPAVSPQRMLFSNPPQRPEGSLQREQGESPQRKPEFTSPRRPEFTTPRKPEFTTPRKPGFTPQRQPVLPPPSKPGVS